MPPKRAVARHGSNSDTGSDNDRSRAARKIQKQPSVGGGSSRGGGSRGGRYKVTAARQKKPASTFPREHDNDSGDEGLPLDVQGLLMIHSPVRNAPHHIHRKMPRDFTKKQLTKVNFYNERHNDPYVYVKDEEVQDGRFHNVFQCDWYKSVIQAKKQRTTEMKCIDWQYMERLNVPLFNKILEMAESRGIKDIMELQHDWNEEIVAQFYATLWVELGTKAIHWMTQGHKYHVTYKEFAEILGFGDDDLEKTTLHNYNPIDDANLGPLYDAKYGAVQYGKTHGLHPYFKVFNSLFRNTLAPKSGDANSINGMIRNLLVAMHPKTGQDFSVFSFIYHEIVINSQSPLRSCAYGPYIMRLIETVTGVDFVTDKAHASYKVQLPSKSILNLLPPTVFETDDTELPPHTEEREEERKKASVMRKPPGTGGMIARALRSIFNVCKKNATDIHEHRKFVQERMRHQDEKLRSLYDKAGIENSPPHVYPPSLEPPMFDDPWVPYQAAQEAADDDEWADWEANLPGSANPYASQTFETGGGSGTANIEESSEEEGDEEEEEEDE